MTLPFLENVGWVWISAHWDHHLSGIVEYNNKQYLAILTDDPSSHEDFDYDALGEDEQWPLNEYTIFQPKWYEMLYLNINRYLFERCVGFHWTYPYRKTRSRMFNNSMKSLSVRFFYGMWNKIKGPSLQTIALRSKTIGIWYDSG